MNNKIKIPQNISLALGGGTAYGLAHAGLLKNLYENKINIKEMSACSMGAIIAGIYAGIDCNGERLWDILYNMSFWKTIFMFDLSFKKRPLFKGKRLYSFLHSFIGDKKIGDCDFEFKIIACTPEEHTLVLFSENTKIIDAVMSSCALPSLLPSYNGLIDGGYNTIVPVNVLSKQNYIIASNVYYIPEFLKCSRNYREKYLFSIIKQFERTREECLEADITLEYNFNNGSIMDFMRIKEYMNEGYTHSKKILKNVIDELS